MLSQSCRRACPTPASLAHAVKPSRSLGAGVYQVEMHVESAVAPGGCLQLLSSLYTLVLVLISAIRITEHLNILMPSLDSKTKGQCCDLHRFDGYIIRTVRARYAERTDMAAIPMPWSLRHNRGRHQSGSKSHRRCWCCCC